MCLGLFLCVGSGLALLLPGGWQDLQRREAYLPALEGEAARHPEDGRLLVLVGARRMEAGEYAGAAEALRQGIADGESSETVWRELAASVAASGDRTRAVSDLRLGLKAFPDSLSLQESLANARAAASGAAPNDLAQAIAPEGASPLVAAYAPASRFDGLSAWLGRRDPDRSGFATREAWARQEPDDAQAQRLWGLALLRDRRVPEAEAALARAVALAPRSPAANLALADLLDDAGLLTKAAVLYVTCLQARPDWLPALLGLGRAALNANLPKYSVPAYQRATEVAPKSAEAWVGLGRANSSEPDLIGTALSAFQTASRLAPDRTDFYTDYAEAIRKAGAVNAGGRASDAEALLRRRIAAAPEDGLAHYLLADILLHGAPSPTVASEAEAETRRALALTPGDPLAQIQLAHILLDRGDAPGATDLLTKALATDPENAPALRTLAQAQARAGQPALAGRTFARARAVADTNDRLKILRRREKATPLDGGLHREIAALYLKQGKPDQADAEQRMAQLIQKDPQAAAAQLTALTSLLQTVLKSH